MGAAEHGEINFFELAADSLAHHIKVFLLDNYGFLWFLAAKAVLRSGLQG